LQQLLEEAQQHVEELRQLAISDRNAGETSLQSRRLDGARKKCSAGNLCRLGVGFQEGFWQVLKEVSGLVQILGRVMLGVAFVAFSVAGSKMVATLPSLAIARFLGLSTSQS
jgi:hypothetical protein